MYSDPANPQERASDWTDFVEICRFFFEEPDLSSQEAQQAHLSLVEPGQSGNIAFLPLRAVPDMLLPLPRDTHPRVR